MAPGLFGELAFDLLLELFIHGEQDRPVSVPALAIGSPPSTALRWIDTLEIVGLAERSPDPADDARSLLRLTRAGREAMLAYLRDW